MSLDQNLFTLIVTPNAEDPNVVDLVDTSGTIHYRKQRLPGQVYSAQIYDYATESLLVTATAPNSTSKVKILELHNPSCTVELKYTGTLSFRWNFKWEGQEFEWKREECYLLRKPDPPVLVAITKEPPGKLKTVSVQILDYNLNRFDIEDRKGLEIVMLTALLTFQDSNESHHGPENVGLLNNIRKTSGPSIVTSPTSPSGPITLAPPVPPPKPAAKTGVDRIAEAHAIRGDINEVTVDDEGTVEDYAAYCAKLLEDEAMLFITVKSASADQVPRVLQVVEETKRIRHKAGMEEENALHQYVVYDTARPAKGPRRIKLDDPPERKDKAGKYDKNYVPPSAPTSLAVHLSKIDMPELRPKPSTRKPADQPAPFPLPDSSTKESKSHKDDKKKKDKDKKDHAKLTSEHKAGKLFGKSRSSSPPQDRVHSNQVHPYQPSPSPAQLNNPMIYAAPPPPRQQATHFHSSPASQGPSFPVPTHMPPPTIPPRPVTTEPSLYGSHVPPSQPQPSKPHSNLVSGLLDLINK